MKCPKCHSDNPDTQRFCGDCGTQLPSTEEIAFSPTETLETPKKELTTGSTFAGRYQIIEELGKGGMGKVYKALDNKINEKIALKLIKPEIASDKKIIERFSNELKMARKISHRNVGRMYHLGEQEGAHYITMEFVPGEDLKSMIRMSGQLGIRTAINIAKQVCEGLYEAHRLGIIHRDLKPQNIMIDKEGNTKIMDFGIARSVKAKGITGSGVMIGTPEYMSPEQVEGEKIDHRSDIYSLGVVLYEMVTGEVPFDGETPLSIALKHRDVIPGDPRNLNIHIPEAFSRVTLRCMEKDRDKRFGNAGEVLSALTRIEKEISTTKKEVPRKKPRIELKAQRKKPLFYATATLIIVLFCLIGYKFIIEPKVAMNSIAVLPFENINENPDIEYLSDGITESLINKLSQVPGLTVISRFSVFNYKGKEVNLLDVGRELNVSVILTGRIAERSDGLSIGVELVDASKNSVIWGEQYNRKKLADIFSVQEDISREISEKLRLKLTGEEKERLAKRYTGNTEAYQAYLKGRFYWNKRTEEGMKRGLDYFKEAIETDPGYALAYAGLADSYNLLARYSYLSPEDAMPKAIAAAQKAIEIDSMLGEAYASLAFAKRYYEYDWQASEEAFKKAIDFNPGYATAHHWYAIHFAMLGKHDESIAEIKRAQELDPLSIIINTNVAWVYYFARQYDQAIKQFKKTIDMDSNFAVAHLRLGRTYMQKGMYEEALAEFQEAITLSGGSTDMIAALAHAQAVSGRKNLAEQTLQQLIEIAKEKYVSTYEIAIIYLGLDQKEHALDLLEKSYDERSSYLVYLRVDPRLDPLRSDSRFETLLKKMNL